MKAFLSSVITGFEAMRNAAEEALADLDHEVIRAETFAAMPSSPQVACFSHPFWRPGRHFLPRLNRQIAQVLVHSRHLGKV
jgi:hypothetical protein